MLDDPIADNPFYVLGLPLDVSPRQIVSEGQRLLSMLALGLKDAKFYATPVGQCERTEEKVRRAMAELRDPVRRSAHEKTAQLPPANPSPPASPERGSGNTRDDELPRMGAVLQTRLRQAFPIHEGVRAELSPRESEILSLVEKGLSMDAIADRLKISRRTVVVFLKRILARIGASDRGPPPPRPPSPAAPRARRPRPPARLWVVARTARYSERALRRKRESTATSLVGGAFVLRCGTFGQEVEDLPSERSLL